MLLNTDGIVLKSIKFEEADTILIIFTRKLGKISALAKGSRRNRSMLLAGTQLFSYTNFTLSKTGGMYKISQCDLKDNFYYLSNDLENLSLASYISQLVESSIFENQTNNRLFDLLYKTLLMYSKNEYDNEYITRIFELKFLDYIGYKPIVSKCANCGNNNIINFSIIHGGMICKDCLHLDINSVQIDPSNINLLNYILSNDIEVCCKAKVSKYLIKQLKYTINKYLLFHLEGLNFKAFNIIDNK